MLIHRISRGAHIVEMDRVSMALQAVQEHGMPSLIAMDLKLPDNTGAAYNAVGLVGHESNGIAVLSEDRDNVVCDELGCEPGGGDGASARQQALYDTLLTSSEAQFRETVNASPRSRYAI